MRTYKVKGRIFCKRDIGIYRSYGIVARDESGKRIWEIPDIGLEKEAVMDLCDRMNQGQPEDVHIMDIIDDFLAE